jgi:hypothetical protein
VNSANTHGILLEVVQVLTDLDLNISKAYIASDGGWFMDGKIQTFLCFAILSVYSSETRYILIIQLSCLEVTSASCVSCMTFPFW